MQKKLIDEYRSLAKQCANTDYADKFSVKLHNKSVDRMYKIVEAIGYELTEETSEQFSELLDIIDDKTNLWAAIHILERLPTTEIIERKALHIIRQASEGNDSKAMGLKVWLNDWKQRNNK
jgi:hypothetical protein